MRVTLESTDQIIQLSGPAGSVIARMWEGTTDSGIKVYCLITRIAVSLGDDQSQFEAELKQCKPPSAEGVNVFPLRMII